MKILRNLFLHFARQDEQDEKKPERKSRNKSDQNTKNQKTKIWDNQNIKRNKNWLKKLWNVGEEHQGAEHSNAEYSSRKHHRKESHRHHRNHDHRFFSFAILAIKIVEKKINSVLFFLCLKYWTKLNQSNKVNQSWILNITIFSLIIWYPNYFMLIFSTW